MDKTITIETICKGLDIVWKTKHTIISLKRYLDNLESIEYLSSGSSRLVYKYQDYAIKIAKNKKGFYQNETETDWGLQQYGVAAKIYHSSEDNAYIVSELCKKCKQSDFIRLENISFKNFCECIRYYYFSKQSIKNYFSKPQIYEKSWENTDSLLYRMYAYIGDFDIPIGDLERISSYGINSQNEIVLVDTGLNNNVLKEYYR